jgi:NAD(P)-dependent dehydrogenase (short-subunit alcohol dehydrogenase family)
MYELAGKVALVTGGSRGMGAEIARALARQGAAVALTYRSAAGAAAAVVDELTALGAVALAIRADHRSDSETRDAVRKVIARFGQIDILVNNAGIFPYGVIAETTAETIEETLGIHVRAPYAAAQEALPAMPDGGRIISIGSSLGSHVPGPGVSLYAASKAALVGLTKALARELGPRGITVNLVNPGSVDTDMNPADGPEADGERALIPLARYGRAEEVAAVVAFLAGPAAAYVNGAVLAVDGGATA